MLFIVEQVDVYREGEESLYSTHEFDELEDARELFCYLKSEPSAIEEGVNKIYLINSDDDLIDEHSFTEVSN